MFERKDVEIRDGIESQIVAIPHNPDGTPVRGPGTWKPNGGRPAPGGAIVKFYGRDERRALASAKRAWWHPKHGKANHRDLEGAELVGATIRIGGEVVQRYDRIPVFRVLGEYADVARCILGPDGAIAKVSALRDGVWSAWHDRSQVNIPDDLMPDKSAAVAVHYDWVDARAEAVAAREAAELASLNASLAPPKKGTKKEAE